MFHGVYGKAYHGVSFCRLHGCTPRNGCFSLGFPSTPDEPAKLWPTTAQGSRRSLAIGPTNGRVLSERRQFSSQENPPVLGRTSVWVACLYRSSAPWPRSKRWDFWCAACEDLIVSARMGVGQNLNIRGPPILVMGSIYQGFILGTLS